MGFIHLENLPSFRKVWDELVEEEIRLESSSTKEGEVEDFTSSKGRGREDLSHAKCFCCHQRGHYASKGLENKKVKSKQ